MDILKDTIVCMVCIWGIHQSIVLEHPKLIENGLGSSLFIFISSEGVLKWNFFCSQVNHCGFSKYILKHIIQNLNSDIKKSRFVCSDIFSNDVAMYICMYVCMEVNDKSDILLEIDNFYMKI